MPILVLGEKPEANKIYSIDDDYSTDIGGNFLPAGAKRKFPYLQGSEVRVTNEVLKELTSGIKRLYAIGSAYYVDFRGRQQTYPIEAIYDISESKFIETYQYADQKKPS